MGQILHMLISARVVERRMMLKCPFDLTSFFRLAKPLQRLLERNFDLCYHIPGFTLEGIQQTDSRLLNWYYSRLLKQLRDEKEAYEKAQVPSLVERKI
jgi:hypothetical protein